MFIGTKSVLFKSSHKPFFLAAVFLSITCQFETFVYFVMIDLSIYND